MYSVFPLKLIKIHGNSMIPYIKPNDYILIRKFIFKKKIKLDDVIVFRKDNTLMIKRVFEINEDDIFVMGDNKRESNDSRIYGSISLNHIIGKVIHIFGRK
jgi:nickel-type superoxide dismutase maturation protease